MRALPEPEAGESVDRLRGYVNVPADDDFILLVAWLVGAFRPKGPYPILRVNGEWGSAKSTLCRILRELIDPNEATRTQCAERRARIDRERPKRSFAGFG